MVMWKRIQLLRVLYISPGQMLSDRETSVVCKNRSHTTYSRTANVVAIQGKVVWLTLSKSCQNADGDTWTNGKWWAVVGADEVICRKGRKTTTIEGNKESVRSTFSSRTWSSDPGVKWRKRRWRLLMTFIQLKRPFRGPVTHHCKRCVMGETGKTIG